MAWSFCAVDNVLKTLSPKEGVRIFASLTIASIGVVCLGGWEVLIDGKDYSIRLNQTDESV